MKKILFAALLAVTFTASAQQPAQKPVQITNRYAMKLSQNADGSYSLINESRYAKILDLSKIEDLLVPYTYERDRLQTKDYRGVEVREFVYTTHKGYDLQIAVDMAESDKPTPVVFYCHGGGWSRGNNGVYRMLSQYMAKQKGVTGVRIAYSLAPQPGADVRVSINDVLAAVQYVRDHAKELNVDPSRMGFVGSSGGARLAAAGAMRTPEAKAFVGYSGIYELESVRRMNNASPISATVIPKSCARHRLRASYPKNRFLRRCSSAVRAISPWNIPRAKPSPRPCANAAVKWTFRYIPAMTTT